MKPRNFFCVRNGMIILCLNVIFKGPLRRPTAMKLLCNFLQRFYRQICVVAVLNVHATRMECMNEKD